MSAARIYTRTGDQGTCQLIGGKRVAKDDPRVECYGTYDEACSFLGLLRVELGLDHPWQERLREVQVHIMELMSILATPAGKRSKITFPDSRVKGLEDWMDELEDSLSDSSKSFLLPGGSRSVAQCHILRTVFRRAERRLCTLNRLEPVADEILAYTNRLSDLSFLMGRAETERLTLPEEKWTLFR